MGGNLDATGQYSMSVTVPNNAALSGQTLYAQSFCDDTSGATGQWLLSPVESATVE